MSRLIDGDYLTGRMFTEADITDAHTCYDSIMAIVESMETVDAIPTQAVKDAIAEIEFERDRKLGGEAFEAVQYKSFDKALGIIRKHTGIGEE